jgi:hypothetical protein
LGIASLPFAPVWFAELFSQPSSLVPHTIPKNVIWKSEPCLTHTNTQEFRGNPEVSLAVLLKTPSGCWGGSVSRVDLADDNQKMAWFMVHAVLKKAFFDQVIQVVSVAM